MTFTGLGLGGRFRAPWSALRVFGRCRKEVLGSRELCRPGPVNHPPRGREAAGAAALCPPPAAHSHGQPALQRSPQGREAWTPGPSARSSAGEPALPWGFLPKLRGQQPWGRGRPARGLGARLSLRREGSSWGLSVKREAHPGPHSVTRRTL